MVFKFAIKSGYIDKTPFENTTLPKNKEKVKKFENYLSKEEVQEFIETLDKYANPLWNMFFYLLIFTGLRRGEALALEYNDIDYTNKTLKINKTVSKTASKHTITPPKTPSSNRTIYLSDNVIERLKSYEKNHRKNNLLFPNSNGEIITLSQPTRQLNKILAKNSNLKHITPHGLRHTHTCLLFEAGASIVQVQQRLGHKDVKITLEIYNHVTKGKEKEAADLFEKYIS